MWTYNLGVSSPSAVEGAFRKAPASARDTGTRAPARRAADPARFVWGQAVISRTSSRRSVLALIGVCRQDPRNPRPQTATRGDKAARTRTCYDRTLGLSNRRTARLFAKPEPHASPGDR